MKDKEVSHKQTFLEEAVQVSESNASAAAVGSKQIHPVTDEGQVRPKRPMLTDNKASFPVDIDKKELDNQLRTSVSHNIPPGPHQLSEQNNVVDIVCSDKSLPTVVSDDKGEVTGLARSCDVSVQLAGAVASSASPGAVGDDEDAGEVTA